MDYSKATLDQLTDEQLRAEWGKYLGYSYERQRLRGLVQRVLRKSAPEAALSASDLTEGKLATAKADYKEILVAKIDGEVHAIDNACGHLAYPLNQGRLDGHVVTCPWHFAQFDIRTGEVVRAGVDFDDLKLLDVQLSADGSLMIGDKK